MLHDPKEPREDKSMQSSLLSVLGLVIFVYQPHVGQRETGLLPPHRPVRTHHHGHSCTQLIPWPPGFNAIHLNVF